jgi:hypothetical protein
MAYVTVDQHIVWAEALIDVRVKEKHINAPLIEALSEHKLTPSMLTDDSFKGYYEGDSEEAVALEITKELAALNMLQEFLEDAIDWPKAWTTLKSQEGYFLVPMNEPRVWGLFAS